MKKNEKKVFLSLVALLLILQFSCCSFNDSISASASTYESTANANLAATKNNSKNSVNIEDDFEGDNKISLEPCYGDYEIIKPNIALYSADATQDQYEENNSFLQAKQLPNSNGRMEDYYFSIYATLHENDLHNALSKNGQYFADTNTGGDEELLLDNYYVEPKNLIKGQYYWYHFTAPDAGNYKFFTISQMDTYGEIFEQIVPARSEAGRLAYNDDSGDVLNFSITYSLRKNQTIYLRVHGFGWNATGAFTPMVMFDSPLEEINQIIRPADLGYKNVYVNEVTTDTIELENGFSFNTERYRCGYINNQYLALSAKRKDVDSAWVELDFNKNLNSIDFYIGLWSNEEYINSSNAYILFQYSTTDGKWVDGIEFDLNTISKNKDSLDHFTYTFTSNVTKVRFYVHTNQVNYEKNKGRVVIGDISIAYSK